MNKSIGFQLVVYSLVLTGLSYCTHLLAPALARHTLIAGLAGGALCMVWGLRAVAGSRGKALPILTLVAVSFVLLAQTVMTWTGGINGMQAGRPAAAVTTLLLLMSLAMLMRIAYAGMVFSGQPTSPTSKADAQSTAGGKPATPSNANKCG